MMLEIIESPKIQETILKLKKPMIPQTMAPIIEKTRQIFCKLSIKTFLSIIFIINKFKKNIHILKKIKYN